MNRVTELKSGNKTQDYSGEAGRSRSSKWAVETMGSRPGEGEEDAWQQVTAGPGDWERGKKA